LNQIIQQENGLRQETARMTHTRVREDDYGQLKIIMNAIKTPNLAETIHRILHPEEKRALTLVNLQEEDFEKLKKIKEECQVIDIGAVVHQLLQTKASTDIVTVEKVMKEQVPVLLVGKPLAGKSFFIKQKLLPALTGQPVLVLDVQDEYKDLKSIGFDIFSLNFANSSEHLRFIVNKQSMVAESEVSSLFSNLEMKRDVLSKWTIIVEECQSFVNVASFLRFVYGSRHIVRKVVCISPKTDCLQGLQTYSVFR
jgi:hypothetical protein